MGKTKLTRGNIFRCDKKTVLLVFLAFIFISLASASSIATPVIMSNSGSNVRNKVSGDLVNNGDLIVSVYNESTGGTPIYSEEFQDVIDNGSWNVILGTNGDLDLEYQTRYYIDYDINGEDIDFRNNEGSTEERRAFDSPYGYSSESIPDCDEGEVLKWNSTTSSWMCAEDQNESLRPCNDGEILRYNSTELDWVCDLEEGNASLPSCANGKVLKTVDGDWACGDDNMSAEELPDGCSADDTIKFDGSNWNCGEDNVTELPVCLNNEVLRSDGSNWNCDEETEELPSCANGYLPIVDGGSWTCASQESIQLNESQIENAVGDWSSDSVNYYNSSEVDTQINSNVFSGDWGDISGVPGDIADGDDDTQLTDEQVSSAFLNENPNVDLNGADDFSGNYGDLIDAPDFMNQSEVETYVSGQDYINNSELASNLSTKQDTLTGDEAIFSGWDKNSADDFSGLYDDLSGTPDFVNQTEMENYVNGSVESINYSEINNTPDFTGWDTNEADDFDGSWESLTDVPADIADGDNDTQLTGSEIVSKVGNWSEDKNDYYTSLEIDNKNYVNNSDLSGYATESYVNNSIESINYSDVNNTPDFTGWDTNEADDFDGSWESLTDVPADIADGDNDTQLNQSEVAHHITSEFPNLDTTTLDDLTTTDVVNAVGNWSEDQSNYYTKSNFRDGKVTLNWTNITNKPINLDTDSTDDFDGNFSSLTDVPTGLEDGDNDTTYNFISEAFDVHGTNVNISTNSSFITVKDGMLTLGDSEECYVGGSEIYYNCSTQTWEWRPIPESLRDTDATYLLDTGDTATGDYTFDSGTFTIDSENDLIGVGTRSPVKNLHVVTESNNSLKYGLFLQNPNTSMSSAVGILFGTDSNTTHAKGALIYERNNTYGRGDFHFLQEYHAVPGEPTNEIMMTIKNNGDVGIGKSNPDTKLEVDGLIKTTPRSSATCDTTTEGSIYYDSDDNKFYGCNSTDWVALS